MQELRDKERKKEEDKERLQEQQQVTKQTSSEYQVSSATISSSFTSFGDGSTVASPGPFVWKLHVLHIA